MSGCGCGARDRGECECARCDLCDRRTDDDLATASDASLPEADRELLSVCPECLSAHNLTLEV